MKLEEYKLIFTAVGFIGVLVLATPALGAVIRFPGEEQFSELYVLGSEHMAQNYPNNIAVGQNYSLYLGVGNHLGSSAYYTLAVKLLNPSDTLPNSTTGAPSPANALYEYKFCISDGITWEGPLTFSVSNSTISAEQAEIKTLKLNNFEFNVSRPIVWDSKRATFSYQLVFELWLYNATSNSVQYDNRFVNLHLNLIQIP